MLTQPPDEPRKGPLFVYGGEHCVRCVFCLRGLGGGVVSHVIQAESGANKNANWTRPGVRMGFWIRELQEEARARVGACCIPWL